MKAWLLAFWDNLASTFWLIPAAMALAASLAAIGLVTVDSYIGLDLQGSLWVWSGGADGARSVLSTVATSMVTVAGTVFSITIAALTLASQQFGPRLLRNFTSDRGNQIVLGTFLSTFLYCLMVIRSVRGSNEGSFVPNIAVSGGVVLAAASIGVLIYFIDHVSRTIQAEKLANTVAADLRKDINRLTPPSPPGPGDAPRPPALPQRPPVQVFAKESGYVQTIDRDGLIALAEQHDLLVRLTLRPGDYISSDDLLLQVWLPPQGELCPDVADQLWDKVHVGYRRTPTQDVRYGIRQLTEIAARALSPGINDPFTAMNCIDWLIDSLKRVAARGAPSGVRCGEGGKPRLIEEPTSFPDLLTLSFDPIRAYGAGSILVTLHVLEALDRLASSLTRPEQRGPVMEEAKLTVRAAQDALPTEHDRERVGRAFEELKLRLREAG